MAIDNITRIGCCIEVILITYLLWKPIDCNRNGLNEGNRTAKIFKQLFNRNGFDPLTAFNVSATNSSSGWIYSIPIPLHNSTSSQTSSELNSLKLNYLLSLIEEEERQAMSGLINENSVPPKIIQNFDVSNQRKDEIIRNNEIELGNEDKRRLEEANKLSLFSSSLNVIDVEPQDTQLAHSVLLIHRPKPNKTVKPTIKPQQQSIISSYISQNKPTINGQIMTAISNITTTTASYPTPVKNNHRPMNNKPFIGLRQKYKPSSTMSTSSRISTTTTTPTSTSTTTMKSTTKAMKISTPTGAHILNIINKTTPLFEEEVPLIFKNNHKKSSIPFSQFTRQKLSTGYAMISTTPRSSPSAVKSSFAEDFTITTPSYITSIKPPYVTSFSPQTSSLVSVVKRPPMKITNVSGNKIKPPEEVYSHGITVLDPPYIPGSQMKLPVNTTIIHKNLIVPMKEGRPKPFFPIQTTTQFPVYPMVAGITKLQTQTTPINSWSLPMITTTNFPEKIDYTSQDSTMTTESSDSSYDPTVTTQAIQRPTLITHRPMASSTSTISHQTSGASHLVTVIPIKGASNPSPSASNTFIVTHSAPTQRPSTSTTGYVNAIWAPPMPIARPIQSVQQQPVQGSPASGGWFSPFSNIFSVDLPNGIFSFLTVLKAVLFTVFVMFLPPLTLAAALMQTAAG